MNWLQKFAAKKTAVLVHGWEGSPTKNWFPWLSDNLHKLKYEVLNLSMPNPNSPQKDIWLKHLQDHVQPNRSTIFIAHSIGCMAVLRYLEKISTRIHATILVAPFVENEKKYKTVH